MKRSILFYLIPLVILCSCSEDRPSEQDRQLYNIKAQFFQQLSELCGRSFEGETTFTNDTDEEMADAKLWMEVRECSENEIRIPFTVNSDSSRTWIISASDNTLLLKHDHRYPDGTPHSLTNYGGFANDYGSEYHQSFEADDETAEMLPEAATNVWMFEINNSDSIFTYHLTRHDEPRYRAEFLLE